MARFEEKEIEAIKQNVSLVRLVESQGYQLKKEGKDYVIRCPFHEDDTASLKITPAKNLFHCFGCGVGGSVIDWVMKTQGVSFRHAVEILKEDAPSLAARVAIKHSTVPALSTPVDEQADAQSTLHKVIDYYHKTLQSSTEAQAYLAKRGLDDPELIRYFKLGYANRTLGLRLPKKNRAAGAAIRKTLQDIGIYRSSGHEHFNGSIVVPVMQAGDITEVYGRKVLGNRLRKGTPQHLYLPGAHKGVFNADNLKGSAEVILCESLIDALTFWRHGFRNVTTSYGARGFTDDLLNCFKSNKVERVLIAYDRDDMGNQAADELAQVLNTHQIDAFRVLFPKNVDANEYALQVQPASKSLGRVIRKAEFMGKGKPPERQLDISPSILGACDDRPTQDAPSALCEVEEERPLAAGIEPSPTVQEPDAAVIPNQRPPDIPADIAEHEINIVLDNRRYRIRGMSRNTTYEQLKINILVSLDDAVYVDTLDLYNAKQRQSFIRPASVELGLHDEVIKNDLAKLLLKLEQLQDEQIKQATHAEQPIIEVDARERAAALELLRDPNLAERIVSDFNRCGLIGEDVNKLTGYLSCVSRKLNKPLAIVVQSTSAAGKTSLMDAILSLIPEEDKMQYAAMTGQSLYYMGETDLKHKILAISEEEGASSASYALKLLQSEGELTIASTGKDESSGDLITKSYRVEGPVMLFFTTTAIEIDEELMNRCLVLTVNEDRQQTQAIHAQQRKSRTLEGLLQKQEKHGIFNVHKNAQRLLRPLAVVNPYAEQLTFVDDKTRTRRDHEKYLTLIDSIALLHQFQREVKVIHYAGKDVEYVEVTPSDIALANRLAHDILGRTLDDLPPQTRKLLKLIGTMVQKSSTELKVTQSDVRFSRKDVREFTGWGNTQLKIHLNRLVEMEHLQLYRRGQAYEYELLYTGDGEQEHHLNGLIDPETLQCDADRSGQQAQRSGIGREGVGGLSVLGRPTENSQTSSVHADNTMVNELNDVSALLNENHMASHPSDWVANDV